MLSVTDAAHRYLDRLLPSPDAGSSIPASAYNVAAQLLSREEGVDPAEATVRTHVGDGVWLTLSAARMSSNIPASISDIAVTIELTSASDRLDLFARSHALTGRETDVLHQVATGADTRTTARALGITELTVQDHLRAIFAKTSVRSRGELLARALGTVRR
ncbi:MAG: LuxR C-terminal-related transcriptional regulator [Nocardioides sp.]|uniref:helix-turn-helix transcriptional regulator n=1 Tax=Nocardioides sp. TaxID=35761 RepID=UPI0039E3A429